MKNLARLLFFFTMFSNVIFGQQNPVSFDISVKNDTLIFNAKIEKGWHVYAAHLPHPNEGPLPTEFIYSASSSFQLKGLVLEGAGIVKMDEAFGVNVKYFDTQAVFKQVIAKNTNEPFNCSGTINYMVCNDQMCIPLEYPFSIQIK
jgi:hypothetical protein